MMDKVLQRQMFSAPQPMNADGVGITSGLTEIAQKVDNLEQQIDNADDYAGVMDALRGDKKSIQERRSELAGYVGKNDANKTPESVLTLVQPTLSIIDMAEESMPAGGINMQAPRQEEAIARIAMGEKPVKRQFGTTDPEGEKISGKDLSGPINLETIKFLQGLVPEPTTYAQNLKYYQDVIGSDKTGFEFNPYISGLNLAAAIANAPQGGLISSLLAPETIKSVSDPILQMAQAKSKTDQAIKLKAAEATAASKAASTKAQSDLLLKLAPELAKVPDLIQFGNTDIGFFAVDPRKPEVVITLKEGLGRENKPFGDSVIGYHILKEDGKGTIQLKAGTGKPPKIYGDATSGYFYVNEKGKAVEVRKGLGRTDQIFGNATTGYFAYDSEKNESKAIEGAEGKTDVPEFIQLMDRYNAASIIVNDENSSGPDLIKAKNEMMFLSDKLTEKDPEFTSLMNQKAQMVYDQTEGTTAEKEKARDTYIGKAIDDFIKGKTTVAQNYNPNEALDKEFANLFATQVKEINKGADNAKKLSDMAEMATLASQNFTTGAFAETRLNITKMVDAVGGREFIKNALGEENYNEFFGTKGNDVPSGELLRSVGAQFAVLMAESFPGNLNQSEVDLIKAAGPSLMVTQKGLNVLNQVFTAATNRALAEAEYADQFLAENAGKGLGAEAKYAEFNEGLRDIRAANPVITDELRASITGAITDDAETPEGLAVIVDGQRNMVPADEIPAYEAVQAAQDKASFLASWPDFIALNPDLQDLDPGKTYDTFINAQRVDE